MPTLDETIDTAKVELDEPLVQRLCYDIALRIHDNAEIGRRYGLGHEAGLRSYLASHPAVFARARNLRALFDSDMSREERTRAKALAATEELIAPIAILAGDTGVPTAQRLDAFKQLNRVAGVDGMPPVSKDGANAGTTFALTIAFADGRTEQIKTTVVDATPQPLLGDDTGDDVPDEDA
jgi:hypothetical protein